MKNPRNEREASMLMRSPIGDGPGVDYETGYSPYDKIGSSFYNDARAMTPEEMLAHDLRLHGPNAFQNAPHPFNGLQNALPPFDVTQAEEDAAQARALRRYQAMHAAAGEPTKADRIASGLCYAGAVLILAGVAVALALQYFGILTP